MAPGELGRAGRPGALAASLIGFSIHVDTGKYDETYGALAAVIILLLWLFLSAFVVLLGAEVADTPGDGPPRR